MKSQNIVLAQGPYTRVLEQTGKGQVVVTTELSCSSGTLVRK